MIEVEYEGKKYEFGFNRETAANLEREGFVGEDLVRKPTLMIPMLVWHAATAYNKGVKRKKINELYEALDEKDGFLSALVEEYTNTMESLFKSPEQGNVTWKRV